MEKPHVPGRPARFVRVPIAGAGKGGKDDIKISLYVSLPRLIPGPAEGWSPESITTTVS